MAIMVSRIGNEARQLINVIGENRESIELSLKFFPTQNMWFFGVDFNGFTLTGNALVTAPNILRPYRDIITFGLSVISIDGQDPHFINDFTDERIRLLLLNAEEVAEVESRIYGI